MQKENTFNKKIIASVIGTTLILVIIKIQSAQVISDAYLRSDVRKNTAIAVALSSLLALTVSLNALMKLKKWQKMIAIFGVVVALAIFWMSLFAASFSGYGSPQ